VPTILIELGLRQIPIVASRVWGTADLVSEITAWPVDEVDKHKAYQRMIDAALKDPAEAQKRAGQFRHLVLKRHSKEKYDAALIEALNSQGQAHV
jgi:hypothetical protein